MSRREQRPLLAPHDDLPPVYTQLTPESLEMLADPRAPVIAAGAEARAALAQRFLDNASTDRDAENDDLVAAYCRWLRGAG